MSRFLGDLIQEGCVTKIADDLYVGGNTPDEVFHNWNRVLVALRHNNLRLSVTKTIVCPKYTGILGWIWCKDTLQACQHKIVTLCAVEPPVTVQGLRSFEGAYKVIVVFCQDMPIHLIHLIKLLPAKH